MTKRLNIAVSEKATPAPTAFGEAHHDENLARSHLRVANAALNFIERGLGDFTGRKLEPKFDSFKAAVNLNLMKITLGPQHRLNPDPNPFNAKGLATSHYDEEALVALWLPFKRTHGMYFAETAPPWLGIGSTALEKNASLTVFGCPPLEAPKDKNPLGLAYEMARFNVARCEQRISLLFTLADVCRGSSGTFKIAAAEEQFNLASGKFWASRTQHLVKVLAFGTLLGGEALIQNQALVQEMYGEGMSVMELVEIDGTHPGMYAASAETKLRKAISRKS